MSSRGIERRTWTKQPPVLRPRIGVDKERTLGVNAAVFAALGDTKTKPIFDGYVDPHIDFGPEFDRQRAEIDTVLEKLRQAKAA